MNVTNHTHLANLFGDTKRLFIGTLEKYMGVTFAGKNSIKREVYASTSPPFIMGKCSMSNVISVKNYLLTHLQGIDMSKQFTIR